MGAGANSGKNKTKALNDRKRRAAGRQEDKGPEREAIRDAAEPVPAKGKTGGAFGRAGRANRGGGNSLGEGGGGGGASPNARDADVPAASRRTRTR